MRTHRTHAAVVVLAAAGALGITTSPSLAQDRTPEDPLDFTMDVQEVRVPMRVIDEQPVIDVMINGEGPFSFIMDTGAAGNGRISRSLVERFGLEQVGEVLAGDPSGLNNERRALVGVPLVSIGGAVFRDVAMLRASGLSEDRGTDGIIGFGLFRELLLTLDYPEGELRFSRGALAEPDGREILANVAQRMITTVEIDVAGTPVKADIDSGSMGWITLPKSVADGLEFASEPRVIGRARTSFNEFEILGAPLKGVVRVGRHEMRDPPVEIAAIFPRAVLGGQFLRSFSITFDQANRRVRFKRSAAGPVTRAPKYRVGVMLTPGADGLTVQGTLPGSPAAEAGLREGDVIIAMNGTPIADLGREQMSALFGQPKPIELTVQRGDAEIKLTLTPKLSQ